MSAFADESCSAAVDVLTFGDDECLEVQGGWFLVYYEWSMKLECLADCDADVSYCAYPTIAPTTTPSRRPTAGPRAARATRAPSLGGDDDDDDGDLSRAAAAVIAGAARGPRPGEGGGARATFFLAQVALFIVGCAAIASVYARRALPHDDATFDTLPTGGAPAPPPVPVAVPAPRRAELESSTRLQCANVLTRALRPVFRELAESNPKSQPKRPRLDRKLENFEVRPRRHRSVSAQVPRPASSAPPRRKSHHGRSPPADTGRRPRRSIAERLRKLASGRGYDDASAETAPKFDVVLASDIQLMSAAHAEVVDPPPRRRAPDAAPAAPPERPRTPPPAGRARTPPPRPEAPAPAPAPATPRRRPDDDDDDDLERPAPAYRRAGSPRAGPSPRSSADRPAWHPVVEGL